MVSDGLRGKFAVLAAGLLFTAACSGNGSDDPDTDEPLKDPAGATVSFDPPGALVPGSGTGLADSTVYAPGIRFPLEEAPAYPNSQVYGAGGLHGPAGGQCASANYSYPWRDNFCETRSSSQIAPLCPAGFGHQGQDIRPRSCEKSVHWAVAAEDGQITNIGIYTVTLLGDSGTQYRYMHMNMSALAVGFGDRVTMGQRLGMVSNDFGGTPTTIHLHFEIRQNVELNGETVFTFVPPYPTLVDAYERLLQGT
jgi:murein DD-endopeptidase MepM/ murein hydrolase activator NlpD